MKQLISKFVRTFFRKELELRVKIFHVLAMAAVIICVATTIVSVIQQMPVKTGINAGTGIISLLLLIYSAKGGKQSICYGISVICVFLILFPSLFLFGGGYTGGMVCFFIFGVVYTVYMLEGRWMLAATIFELVYYSGLCVFAYLYPERTHPFGSEKDILIDVIVGFVVVSVVLSLTMYVQIRMYERQREELEQARDEAEKANRAKTNFLANMSHEVRTPIYLILSLNELISMETTDAKIQSYVEKIQNASEFLVRLLDNILDMAKIEAGKMELNIAPYQTDDLLQVLELVGQSRCQEKQLEFRLVKQELPPVLSGDMVHIQQIMINLISNAVKYTDNGAVTLSVSVEKGQTEDEIILCMSVEDTGIGIKKDSIPLLFEAFSRAEQSVKRRIDGIGLGLAIVKELCNLMGAGIQVESRKDCGSIFTVEIPQLRADMEEEENQAKARSFVAPDAKLLVVDDNLENLSVIRELLSRTKIQVDTVSSGKAALEAVHTKNYHVIFLDYMMPDMDGEETLKRLRDMPGFATPVIVLTANAVSGTRERMLEAGFTEYLTKPIPWGCMVETLIKYLPEEFVTIIEDVPEKAKDSKNAYHEYEKELISYYIDLSSAMPFFEGDFKQYLSGANIFLEHSADTLRSLIEIEEKNQTEELVYIVHTLKGRAENMGMLRLAEEAGRMEKLCQNEEGAEAISLLPHLRYLYKKAIDGLESLKPMIEEAASENTEEKEVYNREELQEKLQEHLEHLQRSPSLACINELLSMTQTNQEEKMLNQMREAVSHIRFEEALAIYSDYLREGLSNGL